MTDKIPMRTVRTSVPPEVFDALEARAVRTGKTLAAVARDILSARQRSRVDEVTAWIVRHRLVLPEHVTLKQRTIITWAESHGFPDNPKEN
jgi:hypothetical protein